MGFEASPSAGPNPGTSFPGAAMPARYTLERGAWAEAAVLTVYPSNTAYVEAMTHFARAIGAARSGKPDAASPDIDKLGTLRDVLVQQKDAYWVDQVEIERRSASAWLLWAQGTKTEALQLMQSAASLEDTTEKSAVSPGPLAPARELLGEMLLEAKQPADALREFEANLKKEPNRFRSVYGAGFAAERAGDRATARRYYAELVKICERGDAVARPELKHARDY